MLINAQRAQQVRVAIIADGILRDYQVEVADRDLCRGNIYRGVVANIQPSLNAAFIDIGEERHGFLPVADVSESAYHKQPPKDARRPRIDQVLEKGKTIVVQVTKDGVGQKGPALTTSVALAGRYLVFTPFDSVRGISRKAEDDDARKKVRERLKKLSLPEGNGVIVRTNGLEQNQTTLNRDLSALVRLWKKIKTEIGKGRGPSFLYSDQNLVVQALRDYLDKSISEVVVDEPEVHQQVADYMATFMPRSKINLSLYNERLPVFSRYRLETQIDRIYERQAPLPSGGYLVIDNTEALTAIDVNSGRATRNNNHDESILNTNLEAAQEVARQLRLRDIGGLVVVDFIDMRLRKHQHKLEKEMRDSMKDDKARYSVGRISSNGLLEINRQRIKQAIRLRTHRPCPTCDGVGTIASGEFAALNLLGRIESRVATGLVDRVTIALHPEIADTLQNHYRPRLAQLESELDLAIEIISAPGFARLEERLDFHQREEGVSSAGRSLPALTATDLTMPTSRGRRSAVDEDDEDQESEESTSRRRRRRRRPGRSRSEEQSDSQGELAAAEAKVTEDSRNDDASDDESERTRTRRRRRRRRPGRSRGTAGEEQQTTSPETNEVPLDDRPRGRFARAEELEEVSLRADDVDGDRQAKPEANDDDKAPARPTRTRRRRRRRPSAGGGDGVSDSPQADALESTVQAEETSAPKRVRSTKADDDDKPAPRKRRSTKAADSDADDGDKPAPRKRRSAKAADSDAADGDKSAPRKRRSAKPADSDAADGDKPAPRKRRSAKATDSDAADGDKPAPRRRRSTKAAESETDNGDKPAPRKRRSAKAADGDATGADKPAPRRRRSTKAAEGDADNGDKPVRQRQRSTAKGESSPSPALRRSRSNERGNNTEDQSSDRPPRQRRRRSDNQRRSTGGESGQTTDSSGGDSRGRRRGARGEVDDNIGNRRGAETHTATTLGVPRDANGDPAKGGRRRTGGRRRRASGDGKLTTPPDITKGDIILPEKLPGAHNPGSPPPRRTGSSTQSLRWQWWGGNDDKGGSSD